MKFEELTVGKSAEFSKTVSDADVMTFAEVTGDFNPVHIDEAAAGKTRFGGRIAHGMLSAGFVSAAIGNKLPGAGSIYLAQTLRFTLPVRIGDTITATIAVTEIMPKRRVKLSTICTNQNGEKVLDGEATVMLDDANG
ncbi:MAG TPA: MaoC family dehydratase [Gemmatimonadaceae bacterium]|nr:MaoC family dehydratase [Gemmatimonadaceae bacterium]